MRYGSIRTVGIGITLVLAACSGRPSPPAPTGGTETAAAGLPFIENDAPKALAEAKTRGVPVFVEAWAPW